MKAENPNTPLAAPEEEGPTPVSKLVPIVP
jgi:hypothetical protein